MITPRRRARAVVPFVGTKPPLAACGSIERRGLGWSVRKLVRMSE